MNEEQAQKVIDKIEEAIKAGKLSDFDLGYIYCLAVKSLK